MPYMSISANSLRLIHSHNQHSELRAYFAHSQTSWLKRSYSEAKP